MPGTITPTGEPVEDKTDESEEEYSPEEDLRGIAQDIHKGYLKFRNSAILRIGVIVVALRVVNVAGAIIIENQRAKRQKQQDEEK
jgi:hypothetical protein